jgi:hypothetical protein
MFKKKFLGVLLTLCAVVLIPSFVLAQTEEYEDTTYEDTTIEYEYDWSDYDDWDTEYEYTYDSEEANAAAALAATLFGGMMLVVIGIPMLISYVYMGLTYSKIAKRLNHPKPWFAWVPIFNIVLHFQLADMSGWFALLMLVPVANIVVYIMAMMKICEKRGMDKLLGLLVLVPIANYILLGLLAWKKDEGTQQPVQQAPQQPTQPVEPQAPQPTPQAPQPTQQEQKADEESYLKPKQTPEPPAGA